MVVCLYGVPAKINRIKDICKRYNMPLIEDAAESFGTMHMGKHTDTLYLL
ncbi:MAG: DegT/DnrJ/EryC1/StrS family aminotransferase [Saccharofermentanales bacterium]